MKLPPAPAAKTVFLLLAVSLFLLLPLLSFDFGITEDEQLHDRHGESVLEYFLGLSDRATRHPLDASGKLTFDYDEQMNDRSGAVNIYGGFFDLLCAATARVSPLGRFEHRHLVSSIFGALLIAVTGLVAVRIAGWRAGVLGMVLLALSPRVIAHSMNNPVDLPFAALYMCSLLFILRFVGELPRPRAVTWIPLVVVIALATDVRIAGLVLLFYLPLFAAVRLWRRRERPVRSLAWTVGVCVAAYLSVSLLWPLAHGDPIRTPLLALKHLSRLETFNSYDLFEGQWFNREDVPWYYAPKWLLIGTPLFLPLGGLLSPLLARRRNVDFWQLWPVLFAGLFPVAFLVIRGSYVYNDARHVLFAYPPLIAVCAVSFDHAWRALPRRWIRWPLLALLLVALVDPLAFMVRNHPNQGVYFSPLVGGIEGGWRRYENDYWGNSVRQAVEWIQERGSTDDARPVKIRSWYGDQTKARYWVEKRDGFRFVTVPELSVGWDYSIITTVQCKYYPDLLKDWPPLGTVYEVKADGVPLLAVVANSRKLGKRAALARMREWAEQSESHAIYYSIATLYFEMGDEAAWIENFRRSAELPPRPVGREIDTYIDLGHWFLQRGEYEDALLAGELALAIDPHHEQASSVVEQAERLMVEPRGSSQSFIPATSATMSPS